MRHVKNLVIGGIQSKVFNLILLTVVFLTVAFTAVSVYHNNMLVDLAAESGEKQKTAIGEITDSVMKSVVEQSMGRSTELESLLADEMFHGLQARVQMLGEYATKLLSDPEQYPRVPYAPPDRTREGEIAAQLIVAEGVDIGNAELADRIGLIANMTDLMNSLYGVSKQVNSCFIALPDGVFLVTDDRPEAKFDENGTPIGYDPRTRPWYQLAVEKGGIAFTDVEIDAFTGDIGIVCSMPVYVNGELAAVVGSDLFLTAMRDSVQASDDSGTYLVVINQNGHVVFSPMTDGIFAVLPGNESADLRASGNAELASIVSDAMHGLTSMRTVSLNGEPYYMIGGPMSTVGWELLSVCSVEVAGQTTRVLQERHVQIEQEATGVYRDKLQKARVSTLILLLVIMALMLASALVLGKRIVQPINTITERISELTEDNMEFRMEDKFRTGDEIQVLAESFASISHKTIEYLEAVQTVTAEKERISSELSLARKIQAAMLPHIFPAFPDRPDFDIFATMAPAREVGGDFYDYFLIDEDHLCMTIADVSGKGVPAALFMMASKIILQSCAMLGYSPAGILKNTNEAICSNNETQMFVTVWVGIVELSTGKMIAANAGHEYPILMHQNGQFEVFKDKHGFVLGGLEDLNYTEYEVQLEPGSKLFVYTDGVTEATNPNHELFGMKRILEALNEDPNASPEQVLGNVRKAVDEFVKSEEQFDDLTMLCMEYKGPRPKGDDRS